MTQQLDRIEQLLTSVAERVERLEQGQQEMRADISQLQRGQQEMQADISQLQQGQQTLQQQIGELQQGQSDIRADIARVDARVDALDSFVHRAADDVAGIAVTASIQSSNSQQAMIELNEQVQNILSGMQAMRSSFQSHIERNDRILEYLMRRLGPDAA